MSFARISPSLFAPAWLVTALLVLASLSLVFFVAPMEVQMGIVQKIFYFHVPSAFAMYVGWGATAVGALAYLASRNPKADALAVAGAEIGMLFCAIVLVTGPLWARKAWGVYWTWDPRLTTTLAAGMIYLAYLSLRSFGEAGESEKLFGAGLAVLGVPVLFLVHYSVQKWRGVHPTVITKQGGGLAPEMVTPFLLSIAAVLSLALLLLWTRYRLERQRQAIDAARARALEADLLENEA
ncbi:MAG: cytochrome c biogenesis protein CcsA [Myxococcales bacterium]|nr:cytochrome c biogenesis protein CcsA [Myxococcales bacterium]